MDATVSFMTQDWWTWWFAVYLFLGGMGAAVMVVAFLSDMYIKRHPTLTIWGMISSVIMLGVGSSMLFIHLLDHVAVVNVLNPLVLFHKPDAWIAWGTQFITWMLIWGVLYPLPYMVESPSFQKIPVLGRVLRSAFLTGACERFCQRYRKVFGWLATINGIGVAVYTGLLLQSFPAVPLWNNPAIPVLFTISAFSTAMAFLLLLLNVFIKDPEDEKIASFYERVDLILIAAEVVMIFAFFQYLRMGEGSAVAESYKLLFHDLGWLIGFIGFGLIVPFLLELKGVIKGWASPMPIITASILVIIGGYLLRHYLLSAGVYAYPW
uniref:Formate-dependent nitrite reductase, membrane component NrfD n=1 Tax=Candidatus Kentrum sp. LFY TaxID=2126342 RepID=A0A450WZB7_9GAMM|nr:MAG: Formate-dependent nitrite reductase, membrane component NrfD [Candidatus Kentron sp. LFY]